MENQYTADQITGICKVSKASFYELKKKNKDFINKNSTRLHRIVYYNQAVLDFFLAYYQPDEKTESGKIPVSDTDTDTDKKEPVFSMSMTAEASQAENPPVEAPQTEEPPEGQENPLQRKIDALEAELEALRKQLENTEAEKKELLRQNGEVLLLLQMEKQEKQLFLPAPRKTLMDRVKSLFHKG